MFLKCHTLYLSEEMSVALFKITQQVKKKVSILTVNFCDSVLRTNETHDQRHLL